MDGRQDPETAGDTSERSLDETTAYSWPGQPRRRESPPAGLYSPPRNWRTPMLVALAALVVGLCGYGLYRQLAAPPDAQEYFEHGIRLLKAGEYFEAIDTFDQAIALRPNLAKAYNARGTVYSEIGEYNEAVVDYSRAIELQPENAVYYCNRGSAYTENGLYHQAIADCNRAIELDPNDPDAYNNRGFVYAQMGDYDQAIADYTAAIDWQPLSVPPYFNRGLAYAEKEDYNRAIADMERVLELSRDPAWRREAEELLRKWRQQP